MSVAQYDVVVVGAGCAGLTAAIGLARAGFAVAVVEAASVVGGANGIGGVCFTENLAQPDILGPEGVEALAWERRLIERGNFATDGRHLFGCTYRDPDAFRHCYTVRRSRFDPHLARIAQMHGAALWTGTTVESLIRDGRRIIGVATSDGLISSDLIFLAEGDAGHLVSREGYDRSSDPRDAPAFLYCLQQVIDLPPGAIEERFQVGPDEGIAYDLLLRNRGQRPLNVRGFVCTNRQSLTVGVVLPAENMRRHFDGEPRQLLDWFADMPALRPWWHDGRRGAWTARLLRAGGLRDVPYLIEDGLAVGGAAAGLGVDFPVRNMTGPATSTGLLLSRATVHIRAEGGDFSRDALGRHYLEPLQQTCYWRNAGFLRRWPGYVKKTRVLFDQELDVLLDSSAVWARRRRWLPRKLLDWFGVLSRVSWGQWGELRDDLFHVGRALRFRGVMPRPALARVVLDGALNAFRDLVRRPRPHLPPGGTLHVHYHSAEDDGTMSTTPALLRRWFGRFRPVLASAGHILYRNNDMPLSAKLTRVADLLVRQINLFDLLAAALLGFLTVLVTTALAVAGYPFRRLRQRAAIPATGETAPAPSESAEDRLASLASSTRPVPSIHIVWKSTQPRQRADAVRGLPRICPAGVFEVRGEPPETVQVAVHAQKCIRCEACWRTNSFVDWGHCGSEPILEPGESGVLVRSEELPNAETLGLLDRIEQKLDEFDAALARAPATVDRPRGDHLEMLARYAQQLAVRLRELLPESALAAALLMKTEERTRRTWDGRFAWAAADGQQLRQHHLTHLRRALGGAVFHKPGAPATDEAPSLALRAGWVVSLSALGGNDAATKHLLADMTARHYLLETLDAAPPETSTRAEILTAFAAEVRDSLASQTAGANALPIGTDKTRAIGRDPSDAKYHRYGPRLLTGAEEYRAVLDVAGDWTTLAQRRALLAEREEIVEAERRLAELAIDWQKGPRHPADEADVSAAFARQTAHVLAGKLLLLRTHACLEAGADAELAVVLLRVWLDYSATQLDEFAILVQDRRRPPAPDSDRPLVEPGSGPPLRTRAEYLAAPVAYTSGDFLLAPVNLLQPRLVPEMVAGEREPAAAAPIHYLAQALTAEMEGCRVHPQMRGLNLEMACARVMLAELQQSGGGLQERCVILQALAGEVAPRWLRGGLATGARHLGRDVLELEALKADFRRRLLAAWQVFGEALGRNADVQASCFALAEAVAWLKAADSTLGRMAWQSRLRQAEERDEPAAQQDLGRRVLAHCHAEVRDRLRRFDEDLAALRRGYSAPHVRAAALLLAEASRLARLAVPGYHRWP
jgi:electron transfer flavoprotein-quinone oxidoreductase